MSLEATRWAWGITVVPPIAKLVLLRLAEMADKDGACYPSVRHLSESTGLAERSVYRALLLIESLGLISVERRRGRPSMYVLHLDGCQRVTPDRESGEGCQRVRGDTESGVTQSQGRGDRESGVPLTESQGGVTESHPHYINLLLNLPNEPTKEPDNTRAREGGAPPPPPHGGDGTATATPSPKRKAKPARKQRAAPATVSRPDDVPEDVWRDFLAHRKAKRAPVTKTALSRIRSEADKAGWPLADALAECTARGWQGFKAEWVMRDKGNGRGGGGRGYFSTKVESRMGAVEEWLKRKGTGGNEDA